MKILVILLITSVNLFAQIDTTKTKTLFGSRKSNAVRKINYIGIYFAPEVQYGSLASQYTLFSGVSAMLVFNKKWSIGMAGYMSEGRNANTTFGSNKAVMEV